MYYAIAPEGLLAMTSFYDPVEDRWQGDLGEYGAPSEVVEGRRINANLSGEQFGGPRPYVGFGDKTYSPVHTAFGQHTEALDKAAKTIAKGRMLV